VVGRVPLPADLDRRSSAGNGIRPTKRCQPHEIRKSHKKGGNHSITGNFAEQYLKQRCNYDRRYYTEPFFDPYLIAVNMEDILNQCFPL
jgi:hypothetical protein